MGGRSAGRDFTGPAGDERDAVAAFPIIALHTAPRAGAVVLMITPHGDGGGHLGAVVAGKNDERVFGQAVLLEGLHQLADDVIHFKNEIAVRPGLGFALESVAGEGRQMHGLHGVK